jgi:hypothetical protein
VRVLAFSLGFGLLDDCAGFSFALWRGGCPDCKYVDAAIERGEEAAPEVSAIAAHDVPGIPHPEVFYPIRAVGLQSTTV